MFVWQGARSRGKQPRGFQELVWAGIWRNSRRKVTLREWPRDPELENHGASMHLGRRGGSQHMGGDGPALTDRLDVNEVPESEVPDPPRTVLK